MSFEDKLNKLIDEAPQQGGIPRRRPAQQAPDFAGTRKAMRRPMVNLDAAIHKIDQFLNTTQQDPSRLDSTVAEIEKEFNNIFEPLRALRTGIESLRTSANSMKQAGFEYVGQKETQEAQTAVPGVQVTPGADEERFLNRVATSIESMARQEDKMTAAKQGFEAYQQQGGKMNRGEFMRALVQKLRLPSEKQALPSAAGSKQYGHQGRRQGELQYHPTRTAPIESSVQRRKLV